MTFLKFVCSLIRNDTENSSKSYSLVLAASVGALIGITIAICLFIDVYKNGSIQTDLDSLGIFLLCVGGYMAGGGLNKMVSEREMAKRGKVEKKEDATEK